MLLILTPPPTVIFKENLGNLKTESTVKNHEIIRSIHYPTKVWTRVSKLGRQTRQPKHHTYWLKNEKWKKRGKLVSCSRKSWPRQVAIHSRIFRCVIISLETDSSPSPFINPFRNNFFAICFVHHNIFFCMLQVMSLFH